MKTPEAVALLVGSTAAYVGACAVLGPWFLKVAIVPLAVFTLYPYLKRFTPFCHFGVGLSARARAARGFAAAHRRSSARRPRCGWARSRSRG